MKIRKRYAGGLLALVAVLAGAGRMARAQEFNRRELFERAVDASAWVIASYEGSPRRPAASEFLTSSGTGFVVTRQDRLMVTNAHVLGQSATVRVYFPLYRNGRLVRDRREYIRFDKPILGGVVGIDARRDLALIALQHLPPDVQPLPLAARSPDRGERILLVGNPGKDEREPLWVAAAGTVEAAGPVTMKDAESGRELRARVLRVRTEMPIRKGNSGGPVVNARGELVGVVTMGPGLTEAHLRTAVLVGGWAAAFPGNPLAFLPMLDLQPAPESRAYCVDVQEVHDFVKSIRTRPKKTSRP
jgi:S1-C subfamily serine protease